MAEIEGVRTEGRPGRGVEGAASWRGSGIPWRGQMDAVRNEMSPLGDTSQGSSIWRVGDRDWELPRIGDWGDRVITSRDLSLDLRERIEPLLSWGGRSGSGSCQQDSRQVQGVFS